MKYRLSVRELAEQDMNEAFDFYKRQEAGLGLRFHDEIAEILRRIESNPNLYPSVGHKNYHKAALRIFPYCIYYNVEQDLINVVAVHDARRDPKRWLRRLK